MFRKTKPKPPKLHEATEAEENEEFAFQVLPDIYAPQHNKRLPRGTAPCLGERVPLTAADKKKVNKASIGLPVARTFKLFAGNCAPFILERCVPVEEALSHPPTYVPHRSLLNTRSPHDRLAPRVQQQRNSLGGTTLFSATDQQENLAIPPPPLDLLRSLQNRQVFNVVSSPLIPYVRRSTLQPSQIVRIYTWLDHVEVDVDTPTAAEAESSNLVSDSNIDEEVLNLDHVTNVEKPITAEPESSNLVSDPAIHEEVLVLDHVDTPIAAEPEYPNLVSESGIDEAAWALDLVDTPIAAERDSPNIVSDSVIDEEALALDHVATPIAAEQESPNLVSESAIDEEGWELVDEEELWEFIEQSCRQRKSRLRQIPNTMSTEINNTVHGTKNSRPSGSYLRASEGNTRTTTNTIKDHPGTLARRPKSMPSGSQLPPCWKDEMDAFICHMEAQCEFNPKSIVKALKQRFAELREVSASYPILALAIYAENPHST